ncbi:MAG: dockerin type I repeat-containing protein [bacterium]
MNQGLTNRNVTALAVNWVDLGVVFAGTEEGVFTYVPSFIGIKGDVNNDGQIDVTDVLLLVNFILGFQEPTADQFWAADYNNDNALNVLDVVLLVNEILG